MVLSGVLWSTAEASWQQVYGRDLTDDVFGPDRMSHRKLRNLLAGLPAWCALWRGLHGSGIWNWDQNERLLLNVLDSSEHARAAVWPSRTAPFEPLTASVGQLEPPPKTYATREEFQRSDPVDVSVMRERFENGSFSR